MKDNKGKTKGKANVTGKSKTQTKAQTKVQTQKKKPDFPLHWYYMATSEITVEDLKTAVSSDDYDIEIWKEAGVLEVGIEEKASMDFEACEPDLRDEYSNQFLKDHEVKALFFVTLPPIAFEKCENVMRKIISANGGFFCADTDDFTPVVD